jgi:hypothetical protein
MVLKVQSADGTIQTVADGRTIKVNSADGTIQELTFSSAVTPGASTFLVAASDASSLTRSRADYLCNGASDEVEINGALAALPLIGGRVVLSEGTFNTAAPIVVPQGTTLEGMGEQATVISLVADPSFDGMTIAGGTKWTVVKNLELLGNAPAVPTSATDGVSISGSMVILENLYIRSFPRNGIYATGFVHLRLINVYSSFNKTGSGAWLHRANIANDAASQIYIEGGNYLANEVYGIWLFHAANVLMHMVNLDANILAGVGITGGTHIAIQNCWFESNENGVYIRTGTIGVGRDNNADEISVKLCVFNSQGTRDIDAFNVTGMRIEDCRGASARLDTTVAEIAYIHSLFTVETFSGTYLYNTGTGSIASGTTSDVITHGLSATPAVADIAITLAENPTNTPGAIWVDTITATQFTVNCENDPGASNLDFGWHAAVL